MIAYQKEKIENAICFFASEHRKKARSFLYQTFLYKYLAFLDFESLQESGRPILGLEYKAFPKGPVPRELYENRYDLKSECFEFKADPEGKFIVLPKGKPNMDYFSQYEIKLMERLIEIYACSYIRAKLISDASHERILAWKKTWEKKPNSIIDYADEFDEAIYSKREEDLSFQEENFLLFKALQG